MATKRNSVQRNSIVEEMTSQSLTMNQLLDMLHVGHYIGMPLYSDENVAEVCDPNGMDISAYIGLDILSEFIKTYSDQLMRGVWQEEGCGPSEVVFSVRNAKIKAFVEASVSTSN